MLQFQKNKKRKTKKNLKKTNQKSTIQSKRIAQSPSKNGRKKQSRPIQSKPQFPEYLSSFEIKVYELALLIPKGQVATYSQIATYISSPRLARPVGTALRRLPKELWDIVPWHRVINAQGKISCRGEPRRPSLQERKLKQEGIPFDREHRVPLALFGWSGPGF